MVSHYGQEFFTKHFLLGDIIPYVSVHRVIWHVGKQTHPLREKTLAVHGYVIGRISIPLCQALNPVTVETQPDPLTELANTADIVRRVALRIQRRLDFPIPPSAVVFLSRQNHRSVRSKFCEILVAPMRGK